MPNVAGKKFPYTKEGMAEAEEAKKKMPKMMKGGKVKEMESPQGEDEDVMPMQGQGNMPLDDEQAAAAIANLKKQKDSKKKKPKAMMGKPPKKKPMAGGIPKMKDGGKVRGYGKARGGKACKMR